MKPIRCMVGLHKGHMKPAHNIGREIDGLSAFVCSRCGAVVE